jgi:hypothetical protein
MNEIIPINESNIVAIINAQKTGLDIGKPFSRQIYLISARIAGSFYVEDIEELVENINTGSKLKFVREPENEYDKLAIIVKDSDGNKLGYVPRTDNPILARLMDAGKLIYGTVTDIENSGDSFMDIKMEIYMDD